MGVCNLEEKSVKKQSGKRKGKEIALNSPHMTMTNCIELHNRFLSPLAHLHHLCIYSSDIPLYDAS